MLLIVCWVIMPIVGSIIAYILFPEAIDKDFERREEKKRKRRPLTEDEWITIISATYPIDKD